MADNPLHLTVRGRCGGSGRLHSRAADARERKLRRDGWQRVTMVMLIAVLLLPGAFAAPSANDDGCGRGEAKTDQGCAKVPRLTHKSEPVYPADARRHHVEGSVTLQGRVNETGSVDDIKVLNGQATDVAFIEKLQDAAIAALGKWRYRPGTIDGKPVPVYITVTMDFVL